MSKNQVLQILYLKHHVHKIITMDRNPQKFDPHEIKQPYRTVLTVIRITKHTVPYNWPAGS